MKSIKPLLLIIMVSLLSMTGPFTGFANDNTVSSQQGANFKLKAEKLLEELRQVTGVPAYSIAVAHKGELIASIAVGSVDLENEVMAKPDHLFRLASVSKVIGATMLADLVDSGQLDPDAPLGSFYPDLSKRYHRITVRQLMAHTSGMPHYQVIDNDIHSEHYKSAIDAVKTLKGRELLARPGATYNYSSHGYTLAGAVYEKITGETLDVSIPRYIQSITGRSTPVIEDITNLHPMTSKLYERSGDVQQQESFDDNSYSIFGAGMSATASDLALFGAKVIENTKNNNGLKKLLFTPVRTSSGEKTGNYLGEVGFGWRIGEDDQGRKVYHHAGVTPGARSVIVLYPDDDLVVTFLSNARWVASIERTAFSLADLYLTDGLDTQLSTTEYSGTFEGDTFTGKILCKDQGCVMQDGASEFFKWLNRFNSTGDDVTLWPMFAYTSAQGMHIVLVTKIGLVTLAPSDVDNVFSAPIGRSRELRLRMDLD